MAQDLDAVDVRMKTTMGTQEEIVNAHLVQQMQTLTRMRTQMLLNLTLTQTLTSMHAIILALFRQIYQLLIIRELKETNQLM